MQCSTYIMSTTRPAECNGCSRLEGVKISLILQQPIIHFRRMILTFIMGVSLVFAAFSSLLKHAMEQVYAEPVRRRPHYQATKS